MLSKHDTNCEQKRFEYIAETGLDPVTGKYADKVGWEGNFKGQTEGTAAGKKFRNADNVLPSTD